MGLKEFKLLSYDSNIRNGKENGSKAARTMPSKKVHYKAVTPAL